MIEQSGYELMSDEALSLEAHAGDRVARNTLYLRHEELISRKIIPAKRLVRVLAAQGAPIDSRDVEQEAFVLFCELLDEWEPDRTPFMPFMLSMIWRRACQYVRQCQHLRSTRVRVVPLVRLRLLHPVFGGQPSDGELLVSLQSSRLRLVEKSGEEMLVDQGNWDALVSTLRDDWKRLVQLRFWEDQSCRQIALREGRSRRTVNRVLSSALAQIRREVEEEREAV